MNHLQDYILDQVAQKRLSSQEAFKLLNALQETNKNNQTEFAVIGMACRFPQASTYQQFWDNLIQKKDAVGSFPKSRIQDVKCVNRQTFEMFRGLNCRVGAYLDKIDSFDQTYFGITPAECRVMDPHQRLFLETAAEALEDAGLTEEALKESKTGVYVGFSINDDNYIDILSKDDPNVALGNQPSVLAYRLSFLYDLRGPTMIIDTACSSSLVAVHQACQAMTAGDCDQAIVGGINIRIFPAIREINNLGIEAYDGRCKSFDEKASGTNIGDGVAALILKRKDLAERDGDYIHAIIKGSAVNSDGSSNGITAPNPDAQAGVITAAWKNAGIDPEKLNFIETHGTGTKLGDPIEVTGLTHAFSAFTEKKQFCALGAVKTNIGHLEAASGMAGLIKAVLCLKYRQLPANIHFTRPNPFIDFENSPVFVNAELKKWNPSADKLLGGVSSFGISGTNCHVVVEEYPHAEGIKASNETQPIFLSAKNEESLKGLLKKYASYLQTCPYAFEDVCYSSAVARTHYTCRLAVLANDLKDLKDKIEVILQSDRIKECSTGDVFYSDLSSDAGRSSFDQIPEKFQSLLGLYLTGQFINWDRFFSNPTLKKVPLPTYAFLQKRHWPKLEIEMQNVEQRLDSICHRMKWVEEESVATPEVHVQGKFLFLMRELPAHDQFYALALEKGVEGIQVFPGKEFDRVSDSVYRIDPTNSRHYEKLLAEVSQGNPLSGIIHMWDCIPLAPEMNSFDEVKTSQDLNAFSAFHLIRACQKQSGEPALKFVTMTAYAHQISPNDHRIDPFRMPALGVNKVISQEYPKTLSVAYDIDIDRFDLTLAKQLIREIFNSPHYKDAVVAYREGKRYIQLIDRLDRSELKDRSFSIRENGVYVIAGGAGYLGMQTALLLSKKARVKIVLLSRRSPSKMTDKHQAQFAEIRKNGSEVIFLQADVTDDASCEEAFRQIRHQFGSINGLFVATKNISHQRLDEVSPDFFMHNILSKVKGVWLLDRMTADQQLDFMATFSSISSLTGGPTGGDCAASNLFLDSYGDYRNKQDKTTITMNFTLIEADDGSLLSDRLSMIPPLTKEEFLQCMEMFLEKELNFAVMADFDSHVMTLVLPFMKLRFSDVLLEKFGKEASLGTGAEVSTKEAKAAMKINNQMALADIHALMKSIWMDVLGYTELDDQADFFEIGGDSISAVKLLHLAKVQLQIELSVSDLYAYPNLQDLSRYVDTKLNGVQEDRFLSELLEGIDRGDVDVESALNLITTK